MLEEATRLRSALKEAQHRRAVKKTEPDPLPCSDLIVSPEMAMFEEAEAELQKNTARLAALRKQVESESQSVEAEHAQLAFLDMAEKEMERTRKRMEELEMETASEATEGPTSPVASSKTETDVSNASESAADDEGQDNEDESLPPVKTLPVTTALIAAPSERRPSEKSIKPLDISAVQKAAENSRANHERSVSMDQRDEQTWNTMMTEAPPTPATQKPDSVEVNQFARPKAVKKDEITFDSIHKEMRLTSSPLVFFNLACFQNTGDSDLDVMLPICGYAVAGRMLCVMGPPGTNTAILRVALSEPPQVSGQREVHVADFTIRDLVEVSDSIIRPDYLAPSVPLLKHLELEAVADIQIGTCIQRGMNDSNSTMGTPRGSRNPEAPTPRNPTTPRFRGTGAGIQKSVLLMEDLVAILDAQSIFRVLKVLRQVASAKRATVLITLSKPFERRGLFGLFDDTLYFTNDGVSYFGPARRLKDYCSLIGHPCPASVHITDHIGAISNAAAKFDESPVKFSVDQAISDFTGKPKEPVRAEEPQDKKSGMFKRKKGKKTDSVEDDDNSNGIRGRRLAQRLAEERRQLAMHQKASEKLDVWRRLTDLDSHIPKGKDQPVISTENVVNFDAMILQLQEISKGHRPSCFMNLACFLNFDNPDRVPASVIQPTCAFANEGQLLGVMGPSGSDAANLLASLKLGGDNTMLTPLTVRDTLKFSEFVKHREQSEKLDSAVELVMGKMMLSACSQEVIGTLIQRENSQVPTTTIIGIGDQTFSTAVRSILILDRILELDAQSVFVVLKLLKRISTSARLAIVLMIDSPEAAEGLFYLLDSFLTFTEEGVGYFGSAKHLLSYCALVGFPCSEEKHVTEHIKEVMLAHPPSKYYAAENNIDTPFTVRYSYSALAKFNKGIIDVSTKPTVEGAASSRTFVPKSFRSKKTSRTEEMDSLIERAEMERQRIHRLQMLKEEEADKVKQRDIAFEDIWKRLAASDSSSKAPSRKPLTSGLKSIVTEMTEYQQKPSLFFNLACFLPDDVNARVDMMQPICGYAVVGRIVAIAGPPETNLNAFLRALSGDPEAGNDTSAPLASARSDVRTRVLTVFELLKIAESSRPDRGSQPIHETTKALMINLGLENSADCKIGSMIQRGVSGSDLAGLTQVPSILMLDRLSESIDAQSAFVVLKIVKRIAAQAHLSVIVHLVKPAERRGLFSLIDDIIVFDDSGVTYFGPANRLGDYLRLVGFVYNDDEHETDACFSILSRYAKEHDNRVLTDTTPPVRYKYSPIADYINSVVTKYTRPSERSEFDLQSHRGAADTNAAGTTFVPKNTRNLFKKKSAKISKEEERRRLDDEEAALKRDEVAAREAEAERMRIAEADAEAVWRRMADESAE